jgi:D-alanyl-D-alanine carboxypeptidase
MKLKTLFTVVALFFIAGSLVLSAPAEAKPKHHKTHHTVRQKAAVDGAARYADIVIEARTGRVLHATNADLPRHPASLTKMMTLYLTFQALEAGRVTLEDRLPISAAAARQSPTKLCLRPGSTISVRDAILGLVTISANDAAVVLAEGLGGSVPRFAQLMTQQAHALGMKRTNFDNPNGLPDPKQVTTAHDMALLAQALIYHYPRYYPFFAHESYVYAGIERHNHNHLMERYEGMDGIKTGYVRASGFNLVASAHRGDTRLIGVVFGGHSAPSRDNQMAELLDQCFAAAHGGKGAPVAEGDAAEPGESGAIEPLSIPPKVAVAFPAGRKGAALAASGGGAWGIQVGAFADQEQCQGTLVATSRRTSPLLAEAKPAVDKLTTGSGAIVYRARFLGLEERMARSVCAYLVKHGQNCLVVAPEAAN